MSALERESAYTPYLLTVVQTANVWGLNFSRTRDAFPSFLKLLQAKGYSNLGEADLLLQPKADQ